MKWHWAVPVLASILIMGGFGLSQQAFALSVSISSAVDSPGHCDTLVMPPDTYDELGTVHPIPDELISSFVVGTTPITPCPVFAGGAPEVIVSMTNLSPHTWEEVWYYGDPSASLISNFDGTEFTLNQIFKIDSVGANKPLISESSIVDDKWQPSETWEFVIQDYSLPTGTAASFGSLGVGGSSAAGSTASIVALKAEVPVGGTILPIDTTALLLAGVQSISMWMILGVLSLVGIGLAVFTLKRSR